MPDADVQIGGEDMEISCYPLLLQEVFYNIIINAFVHGATKAVVEVYEGENVIVKVKDNGLGVPEDMRERIFDPFFKHRSGGTGLGLAIVYRIIELHGGSIHVEDNNPHGSVFVIELPKAR